MKKSVSETGRGVMEIPGDTNLALAGTGLSPGTFDEHILEGGKDIGPNGAGETVRGTLITSRGQRRQIMKENKIDFGGRRYGQSRGVMF